jgi:hypothetical protein
VSAASNGLHHSVPRGCVRDGTSLSPQKRPAMTIWLSPRGRARHDTRIKALLTPGDRMAATNIAVVAIRPAPRLISGAVPERDFDLVATTWIARNAEAVIDFWNGTLSTVEFVQRMKKLASKAGSPVGDGYRYAPPILPGDGGVGWVDPRGYPSIECQRKPMRCSTRPGLPHPPNSACAHASRIASASMPYSRYRSGMSPLWPKWSGPSGTTRWPRTEPNHACVAG